MDSTRLCGRCGDKPARYTSPAYCEDCRRAANAKIKARRKIRIMAGEIPAKPDKLCATCGVNSRNSSDPSYCADCQQKQRQKRYQKIHPPRERGQRGVNTDTRPCGGCHVNPRNSSHPSYCVGCLQAKSKKLSNARREENKNHSRQRCGHCKGNKLLDEYTPSDRGIVGSWCKTCASAYARGELGPAVTHDARECDNCGGTYVPIKSHSKYCSIQCNIAAKSTRRSESRVASRPDRFCQQCGEPIPRQLKNKLFCSRECGKKADRLKRKLTTRVRMEVPTSSHIFAQVCIRDNWMCGLCRLTVDKKLLHPDPMSASIDHIIQVAWGGTNDLGNLRLTHLVCNQRRPRQQSS